MIAGMVDRDSSESQRKGLRDGCETCWDVWFGDGRTDEEIGGRAESGRVEETEIFTASDQDGKNEKRVYQRERSGWAF